MHAHMRLKLPEKLLTLNHVHKITELAENKIRVALYLSPAGHNEKIV